jgi:hypothetical protein
MLNRIDGLLDQLEQAARREQSAQQSGNGSRES